MLNRKVALAALVLTVLFLAGMKNKGDLMLRISVFNSQFFKSFAVVHRYTSFKKIIRDREQGMEVIGNKGKHIKTEGTTLAHPLIN